MGRRSSSNLPKGNCVKVSASFGLISPRRQAALELRDTVICLGLDQDFHLNPSSGLARGEEKGKTFWSISIERASNLTGEIRVFGDRFIQVKFNQNGKETRKSLKSVYEAKRFLIEKFV